MKNAECNKVYIPSYNYPISNECIRKWYDNILIELEAGFLTQDEQRYLADYYHKAGLLRIWRRNYFYYHFTISLTKIINHFLSNKFPCRILDLGCGVGTQSLFFALLGGEVIGLDKNEKALSIFERRKVYYEQYAGRELKIQMHCSDALSFNYKSISPIDYIYSMFAFSYMPQTSMLITKFTQSCTMDSSLLIQDTNFCSFRYKIVKPRWISEVLCPKEIVSELQSNNWEIIKQSGAGSIHPIFWYIFSNKVLHAIDGKLSSTLGLFSVSYLILAKKKSVKGA